MLRALDPYHRIRATVAAIFLLTVMALAVLSTHGSRRGVAAVSTAAPGGVAAVVPAVPAVVPASTVAARRGAVQPAGSSVGADVGTARSR